jgi:hypothetical protein
MTAGRDLGLVAPSVTASASEASRQGYQPGLLLGWVGRRFLRGDPFRRRGRLGRNESRANSFSAEPASLLIFRDNPVDDRGQSRHLEQGKSDSDSAQVLSAVPVIQATSGDGAHLVVELRPANMATPIAEAYEVDRLGLTLGRFGR